MIPLSPAQKRVADHLVEGRRDRDIASRLGLSARTVSVHISAIMSKVGATNRTQAVAILIRNEICT